MVMRVATFVAVVAKHASSLDNGLGLVPPMGYNTWNDLGCKQMSEDNVKAVADSMVSTGLLDAGYNYLNLDDCWMASNRDKAGRLQGDPTTFPSGIKSLADHVHSKGLKFGIYSDRGDQTCQGLPASLGSEKLDAQTFADWGVDYLKEDNCHSSTGANDQDQLFKEFGTMRDALNATGRPIFFSVCGGGDNFPWSDLSYYATDPRGARALANAWRISSDVVEWQTCQAAYHTTNDLADFAGSGGINDPDMLLGSSTSAARTLSAARSRTQFNLWAILMAPLMIGANLRELNAYDIETYTNAEVISVNQDPLGKQGKRIALTKRLPHISLSVWMRELANGDVALAFVNNYLTSSTVVCDSACWAQLPIKTGTALDVRDLWTHNPAEQPLVTAGADYRVALEGGGVSAMLRLSPRKAAVVV